MAITKQKVDKDLRDAIFYDIFKNDCGMFVYKKINDRQYGVLLNDANGIARYVRIGAIVAELREDMTAGELMDKEIAEYNAKQEAKAEKAKAKEAKIAKDKAKREEEKKNVIQ